MDKKTESGHSADAGGQQGASITPTDAFEVHRQMVIALFVATTILSSVVTIGLIISDRGSGQFHLTALMAVAVAGALGGFVSALRRLYAFQKVFPSNFFWSVARC
jgi:hypothetical protein